MPTAPPGWKGIGIVDKAWTTPPAPCHAPMLAAMAFQSMPARRVRCLVGFSDVAWLDGRERVPSTCSSSRPVSRPAPPPDPPARYAASPSPAATFAARRPPAAGPRPHTGPAAGRAPSSRRTTVPNSRHPEPPAEPACDAGDSACGRSRGHTPAHGGPPSASASTRDGSGPPAPCPCGRRPTGGKPPAFTQRAKRAAKLFMPFARRCAPAASTRK